MTWEQFLFNLGREFDGYSYEAFEIYKAMDYFKLAHKNGISPATALEYFNYYLLGENVFE
jgi:hypothetical protein